MATKASVFIDNTEMFCEISGFAQNPELMKDYNTTIQESISELYKVLEETVSETDMARIKDAFELAHDAHKDQYRKSGLPYIMHPIAVAKIVAQELELGPNPVIAALLHDVVEDTPYTLEDVQERFGDDVAFLVDVVTKKKKDKYNHSKQVDNFRQLLDSMQYDVRAVLIKMADRLHNMRTLESMKPDKQMKIAGETDYFYAPLANRLGLYHVKSELETLSFRFRCPREYSEIATLLENEKERDKEYLAQLSEQINTVMAEAGIKVRTQVRYKMPYSIWRKMRTKGCDFDHAEDKHYIRIIFPDTTGMSEKIMSLRIYAVLTDHFKERPGSFSNYIDAPKENGYESLHIKILNSRGTWEEIHIASERMVRKSRLGCAAEQTSENLMMWLNNFKDVLKKVAADSATSNFIDEVRLLFEYNDDIMVFTPKGENIVLPKGATALDYAFHIHGHVGEHAMYARINGKLSSVKTHLHRGDCVEIGLGEDIQIKEDWLGHMVTYKAKKAVKSFLAKQPKPEFTRCPCCNPLPGDEVIGYGEDTRNLVLHKRDCHELIRLASQHGNHIHEADLHEDPDTLYPVRLIVRAVDRYHLLSDLIDCITEKLKLSMESLATETVDNIGTCTIDFCIHSADELRFAINSIKEIEGVDEVSRAGI